MASASMTHGAAHSGAAIWTENERVELGGVDLLAIGAYSHSRIRSLIVGSTTAATARRCRIPVLMFR
jgi:nucleotide-binding universal stress UspA family protein